MIRSVLFLFFLYGFWACQPVSNSSKDPVPSRVSLNEIGQKGLDKYWYEGKAEINRYALEQNRYKDLHPGEAVLVFVTEDFRSDIQVKSEGRNPDKAVSTLKTNFLRRFPTGLYDYSIMTSVFTPVAGPESRTFKVSMSSQDWCGQSFMQLNLDQEEYRVELRSYFEGEGDQDKRVAAAVLEDELFNRVRIDPDNLPRGSFSMLPSTSICRLMHLEFDPVEAEGIFSEYSGTEFEGKDLRSYLVKMPSLDRELEIVFEGSSPYRIAGWTDSYPSAFDQKVRRTKATLTKSFRSPYWRQNKLEDMVRRDEIGLGKPGQ